MTIDTNIQGIHLSFETESSLFSPQTMGIYAAKLLGAERVHMIDNDPIAIRCAEYNAQVNGVAGARVQLSDGFRGFRVTGFTKILCNPPYHTDFSVAKHFIEKGFNRLVVGGAMWLVTKRDQWYRNKLSAVFGGVGVAQCDSYFTFEARKKTTTYSSAALKKQGQRPRKSPT